ncbi:MAG: LPP20 family lipoprotein [Treponema sp.]|jgi:hypothetical protein|nr:LPP20 family lipoprotein [Treponema sp.]
MFKIKNLAAPLVLAVLCFACGSAPGGKKTTEPAWVSDPYAAYNRNVYLAAVGLGTARDAAEKAALNNLTSIFGQSVTSETKTDYSYSQAINASSSAWSERTSVAQAIKTSVAMDTLIGAETKDVWRSPDGTWYASAIMDKAKTNMIYLDMIQQNQQTITKLTALSASERQSLEGLMNYYQAANLADANQVFANVRNVISPGSMAGINLRTGNDLRLEASRIARDIPITVIVENDRRDRIRGAFSEVLTKGGFRTGGSSIRYVLAANLSLDEVVYPNTTIKYIRYVVDADLIDTSTGAVLFPYNINDREGHAVLSEAETRAVASAESRIKTDYMDRLGLYLSGGITK